MSESGRALGHKTAETRKSKVPKHLIGQALMQLDRVPLRDFDGNQEYAPPGTAKWVAETIAYLGRLVDGAEDE